MNTLEQILEICNTISATILTPATVCDILEGVDAERNPALRGACLRYISEHYEEVIRTVGTARRLSPAIQREIDRIRESYHHPISPSSSSSSASASASSESHQQPLESPIKRRRLSRNFDTEA
jgi:hypothetical protein